MKATGGSGSWYGKFYAWVNLSLRQKWDVARQWHGGAHVVGRIRRGQEWLLGQRNTPRSEVSGSCSSASADSSFSDCQHYISGVTKDEARRTGSELKQLVPVEPPLLRHSVTPLMARLVWDFLSPNLGGLHPSPGPNSKTFTNTRSEFTGYEQLGGRAHMQTHQNKAQADNTFGHITSPLPRRGQTRGEL